MTPDEIRAIATDAGREAAHQTVRELLEHFGIDVREPLDMQEDMAFLRKQRKGSEQIVCWVKRTCIVAALAGALALLWNGFKADVSGFWGKH